MLPQGNGFIPLQMNHWNGKFCMTSASSTNMKAAINDVCCESSIKTASPLIKAHQMP